MLRRCLATAVFAVSAIILACTDVTQSLSPADTLALRAIDSTYVARVHARDWPGLAALLTDDVVMMPPNAPAVVGTRDNLARYQAFQFDSLEYAHFDIRIAGEEGIAYMEGQYRIRMAVPNMPAFADSGKHLWVLLRQPSGEWRLRSIIWNSSLVSPSPS